MAKNGKFFKGKVVNIAFISSLSYVLLIFLLVGLFSLDSTMVFLVTALFIGAAVNMATMNKRLTLTGMFVMGAAISLSYHFIVTNFLGVELTIIPILVAAAEMGLLTMIVAFLGGVRK